MQNKYKFMLEEFRPSDNVSRSCFFFFARAVRDWNTFDEYILAQHTLELFSELVEEAVWYRHMSLCLLSIYSYFAAAVVCLM